MSVSHRTVRSVTLAAVACAVLCVGWSPGVRAAPQRRQAPTEAPTVAARYFSANLAIRHRRVARDGTPMPGPTSDLLMRVVREQRAGRWHTQMTVERPPEFFVDLPGGRTRLDNPFLVVRAEMNDDEVEPRLYDRQGRRVAPMSAEDLQVLGVARGARAGAGPPTLEPRRPSPAPAAAWLAEAGRYRERRDDLVRTFGAAVGRIRGLDHYVTTDETTRHEALVTPDTALPLEVSTTMADGTEVRTEVEYEPYGTYGHVRRLLRSRHRFAQASFGGALTEVELANVVIAGEVPR